REERSHQVDFGATSSAVATEATSTVTLSVVYRTNVACGAGRGLWKRRLRRLRQQKLIAGQGGQGRRQGRG
ncbi:unnamed protein product, partial [Ectocarpus fasciculatus]